MSNQSSNNNKRIAKNTIALYFRQILVMLVSLYTSRVILQVLGVEDFGIYNVVGGIVAMFSFITGTLGSASQRFLAYDMANGDAVKLRQTFSLILMSYFILIVITVLLSESIAVWFLNTHMMIPLDRMYAANWVLQFSILTFCFHILQAPYMSVIIAHEKMNVYAYVSIVEVVLKLAIVYMLQIFAYDKLIAYAILMCLSSCSIYLFYYLYCRRKFTESRYLFYYDRKELKSLCSYAWWNVIGSLAIILRSQGINVLLNMFFNPAINAARGIAYQVNTAVTSFYTNFYTAVRPQIVKSYATGDNEKMLSLISNSSRYAYFLILIIILPLMFYAQDILAIWLKTPPELTDIFMQTVLVSALIETLSMPLVSGMQAANKIKEIQLTVSMLYLLNIPVSYILLRMGLPAITPMYVNIALILIAFVPRLWLAHSILGLSLRRYAGDVLLSIFYVSIVSVIICYIIYQIIPNDNIINVLIAAILMLSITLFVVSLLGMTKKERNIVISTIKNKLNK